MAINFLKLGMDSEEIVGGLNLPTRATSHRPFFPELAQNPSRSESDPWLQPRPGRVGGLAKIVQFRGYISRLPSGRRGGDGEGQAAFYLQKGPALLRAAPGDAVGKGGS